MREKEVSLCPANETPPPSSRLNAFSSKSSSSAVNASSSTRTSPGGVTTKALNQAVKRNADRFPSDFVFRLTRGEKVEVVTNCDHLRSLKFSPQLPHAFTEHEAIMAATVLNSHQAVKASLFVVRAFVKLRELLSTHHQLADKLNELEHRLQNHDDQILALVDAIRQLMEEPEDPPKPPIDFATELELSNKSARKAGRRHQHSSRPNSDRKQSRQ